MKRDTIFLSFCKTAKERKMIKDAKEVRANNIKKSKRAYIRRDASPVDRPLAKGYFRRLILG